MVHTSSAFYFKVRDRSGQSQELGASSGFPIQKPKHLLLCSAAVTGALAGNWIGSGTAGTQTGIEGNGFIHYATMPAPNFVAILKVQTSFI